MSRIDISQLQVADVLFSRELTAQSIAIQLGSLSDFSHVLIYSGDNKIIQATGSSGVSEDPISYLRTHRAFCEVYRHKAISRFHSAAVVRYCREAIGQPYDFSGAALSVFGTDVPMNHFELHSIEARQQARASERLHDSVYCSQLIALAFESAGIPIVHPGHAIRSNPGTMRFAHALRYVGELY
jgi:uncharacterized protein YycO